MCVISLRLPVFSCRLLLRFRYQGAVRCPEVLVDDLGAEEDHSGNGFVRLL